MREETRGRSGFGRTHDLGVRAPARYSVGFHAETGGQNVMLVDSSALPEQVVVDVISSAFLSAGQRCSALRVLYLQEDVDEISDRLDTIETKSILDKIKLGGH